MSRKCCVTISCNGACEAKKGKMAGNLFAGVCWPPTTPINHWKIEKKLYPNTKPPGCDKKGV